MLSELFTKEGIYMSFQVPKGTRDLLKEEALTFDVLENYMKAKALSYGYQLVRVPIFEHTDLFVRGVGETSDIVTKEMYTFLDKGQRSITLRPEFTAGVLRAAVNAKLDARDDLPIKLAYVGPVFRYERPQLGRYRQFNQFGVEQIGTSHYYQEVETVLLGYEILRNIGFKDLKVVINNLGDENVRNTYRQALVDYFKPHIHNMCHDCQLRYTNNPLRILDCKVEDDRKIIKKAPNIQVFWTEEVHEYMDKVTSRLKNNQVSYELQPNLVRGLDYYSNLVFEYYYTGEGGEAFGAIGAGGHYDKLFHQLGGSSLPGIGFSLGVDRLIKLLIEKNLLPEFDEPLRLIFLPLNNQAQDICCSLLEEVRAGIPFSLLESDIILANKSLAAMFKIAERKKAHLGIILGEDELKRKKIIVRDLASKEQQEIDIDDLVHFLTHQLGIADHDHHHE